MHDPQGMTFVTSQCSISKIFEAFENSSILAIKCNKGKKKNNKK